MATLKELFQSILDQKKWSYYGNHTCYNIEEILNNPGTFINNYFEKGEKTGLLLNLDLDDTRKRHAISSYLLGIYFYNNIPTIKKSINEMFTIVKAAEDSHVKKHNITPLNDDIYNSFLYCWFLTCLYHDYGYCYEKRTDVECSSRYPVYNLCLESINKDETLHTFIPNELIKNWIKYYEISKAHTNQFRRGSKIDHGIAGGCLLFTRMKELYFNKLGSSNYGPVIDDQGLRWADYIIDIFIRPVAYAVTCHNIHLQTSKHAELFNRYGASELVTTKAVVKLENHPLLYLLMLVDSIEPLKRCKDNHIEKIKLIKIKITSQKGLELQLYNHPDDTKWNLFFLDIETSSDSTKRTLKSKCWTI